MTTKIGSQHGVVAFHNRQRDMDPAGTLLKKKDGKWPDMWDALAGTPLDQWKAIDKHQRAEEILVADHDGAVAPGPKPEPPPDGGGGGGDTSYLETVRARIFLAHEVLIRDADGHVVLDANGRPRRRKVEVDPLAAMQAPSWMVPVCTADLGYRSFYPPSTIEQLRARFGRVEAWVDCRNPTEYAEALRMCDELGLDGAWGQCETRQEYDNAYAQGCRRMVGKCSVDVLDDARLAQVASAEVLLSVELYQNCMPWEVPDWRNANAGIGGHCIACYADATPCVYTPVSYYKSKGYYVPHEGSVYGVGLTAQDWQDLGD